MKCQRFPRQAQCIIEGFALSHAARKIREADTEARRIVSVNKGKVMHKTSFIHDKGAGDKSVSPERDVGDRALIIDHAVGFTGARGRANGANLPNEPPYEIDLNNPFPMMKLNSDVLYSEMSKLIQEQEAHIRQRIFNWFLL